MKVIFLVLFVCYTPPLNRIHIMAEQSRVQERSCATPVPACRTIAHREDKDEDIC